jgi:hypothetical protein
MKYTHNQSINATNINEINASNERGSDFENFGTRITGFGFSVAKIWRKEVIGTYL